PPRRLAHDRQPGRRVRRCELARARGPRDVRHPLRGAPEPDPPLPPRGLHRQPPPPELPAPQPRGEAVARWRGRGGHAHRGWRRSRRRAEHGEPGGLMSIDADTIRHLSEVSVSVELQTEDMTLNIGPQHPSTHGVLRLVARVDGERAFDVQPVIGYMHRGYEKLAEVRTYPQITTIVNRIDWVAGYANEIPFITAAEKIMELEVPPRAQYIRLILTEMARICSHLVFMASYPLE